jgi:hypothetical protein
MKRRSLLIGTSISIVVLAVVALAIGVFLSQSAPVAITDASSKCEYCHENMDRLSEQSDTPEKLYVDPAQFAQEAHGGIACTACHGCDTTQKNPEPACTNGHAYQNPADTAVVLKTCGSCHPEITARSLKSIHTSLEGIHTSLVDLLGEKEGTAKFQQTCNQCHTTCSSCHMETPDRRDILWPRVTSHHFETKSNSIACAACHGGMGDTFFGTTAAPIHEPSMMAKAGMQCVDCHSDTDVHGTGVKTSFSMQSPKPTCEECHNQPVPRVTSDKDTLVAPQYSLDTSAHKIHPESELACVACHTEYTESCWNCHDGRTEKTNSAFYLAVNPLNKLIQPASHSPATSGNTGPIPTALGGGWAIKSRHSWGESHTCEDCHTDISVYVSGADRQAPFVGYWATNHANASFVDEKLAQVLVIDTTKLKVSAHKDQTCNDCHATVTDAVCTDCHNKTKKTGKTFLSGDADWSRSAYVNTQTNLDQMSDLIQKAQSSGMNVADWQKQWSGLKSNYLKASNDFHSNPGQTLAQVKSISSDSQALLSTIQQTVQAKQLQDQWTPAGVLFGAGMVGALGLGLVVSRRKKS